MRRHITVIIIIVAHLLHAGSAYEERREKRAVVIDFGLILRNLLLKSAQLSNAKVNITRAIVAAKLPTTTTTTTTTSTTTTTPMPVRQRRPIYKKLPLHQFYDYDQPRHYYQPRGYVSYDYDGDYVNDVTTTAAPPPRAARKRLPPAVRPPFYRPIPAPYDYDHDFDYETRSAAPAPPPQQQATRRRLRPAPVPAPVPAPQPAGRRKPQLLHNNLVYQYAQTDDTYSNDKDQVEDGGRDGDGEDGDVDDEDGGAAGVDGDGDEAAEQQEQEEQPQQEQGREAAQKEEEDSKLNGNINYNDSPTGGDEGEQQRDDAEDGDDQGAPVAPDNGGDVSPESIAKKLTHPYNAGVSENKYETEADRFLNRFLVDGTAVAAHTGFGNYQPPSIGERQALRHGIGGGIGFGDFQTTFYKEASPHSNAYFSTTNHDDHHRQSLYI